jgi:hypothetical protein
VCYPRIYQEPESGSYCSAKSPARLLAEVAYREADNAELDSDTEIRTYLEDQQLFLGSRPADFETPMFWLTESIAMALSLSTLPGEFNWIEMHLPHEACVFMMPRGSLVHKKDGEAEFIAYARLQASQEYESRLMAGLPYSLDNDMMIFLVQTASGEVLQLALTSDVKPTIGIPDVSALVESISQSGPLAEYMADEDNRVIWQAIHYVFGAIFLMFDKPSLVTAGTCLRRVAGKRGEQAREFWAPNVIGEKYRLRQEPLAEPEATTRRVYTASEDSGGNNLMALRWPCASASGSNLT